MTLGGRLRIRGTLAVLAFAVGGAVLMPNAVFASTYGLGAYGSCGYENCAAQTSPDRSSTARSSSEQANNRSPSQTGTSSPSTGGSPLATAAPGSSKTNTTTSEPSRHKWGVWFYGGLVAVAFLLFLGLIVRRRRRNRTQLPPSYTSSY